VAADLHGFRYWDQFRGLFDSLHTYGIDPSGNRQLFFDQYAALLLLYFFSPTLTSLRGLQQATTLDKVQQRLGLRRTSRGALSEAAAVFDPELLRPILAELAERAVPVVRGHEAEALRGLTAVDGSLLPALPRMAWALWRGTGGATAAKMHVHFDVLKAVPCDATVTPGACSELEQLQQSLRAHRLYVLDRGYAGYGLLRAILDAGSSFVVRLKDTVAYTVAVERPLTAAGQAAGVVRDLVAQRLGADHHKDDVGQSVRLIWTRRPVPGAADQEWVLCTDRLTLDADLVVLAYHYRWWIELFFRWLKCILGCRHLLSAGANGVTLQVYLALIASLIISLWTGHKPTKRTYEMCCFYFSGWASADELQAHIEQLHRNKVDST
jgi:hypothetical protein